MTRMLQIVPGLAVPLAEVELTAVASQGAGGQNVNKVASAIHLRFDLPASSLPTEIKERLLAKHDRRITGDGIVVLKAQRFRTQEQNRADALRRLAALLAAATLVATPRRATRPSRSSQKKRIEEKKGRGQIKALRRKVSD